MINEQLLKKYLQRMLINDYILISSIDVNTRTFEATLLGDNPSQTYVFDCQNELLTISTIKGKFVTSMILNSELFVGLAPLNTA